MRPWPSSSAVPGGGRADDRAPARAAWRRPAAGTRRSRKERADLARGEEPCALAVPASPLPREGDGPQAERNEQEPAGPFGLAGASVFGQEAQDPAQVLDVEAAAVR